MKISFVVTMVVEMDHPEEYGHSEPTIESTATMLTRGEARVEVPELMMDPVFLLTQEKRN